MSSAPFPTRAWTTAAPDEVGLARAGLEAVSRDLRARHAYVRALLVVRGRALAWEEYRHGCAADDTHHIASVTKSFTAALVGLAIGDGAIAGPEAPVDRWLHECVPPGAPAPRLRDLMTMTAEGFCPRAPSPGLRLEPSRSGSGWGTTFHYSDHQANLVALCVDRAIAGGSAKLARERLLGPLGIHRYEWYVHDDGSLVGGFGLHVSARDLAKFGLLHLEDGMWDGSRILSREWVRLSTAAHNSGGDPVHQPYGYLWWSTERRGQRIAIAAGMGGQRIYVVPAARLVVVTTADQDSGSAPDDAILPWLETVLAEA